jgi:hypothetical protein
MKRGEYMGSGEFKVHYIDIAGCICFEVVKAINEGNAADLIRASLPVDEIVSINEVPHPWIME